MGDVPCILCGDFNVTIEESVALRELLEAGWVDAAVDVLKRYGIGDTKPQDTCFRRGATPSRIDMVLLNGPAQVALMTRRWHSVKLDPPIIFGSEPLSAWGLGFRLNAGAELKFGTASEEEEGGWIFGREWH